MRLLQKWLRRQGRPRRTAGAPQESPRPLAAAQTARQQLQPHAHWLRQQGQRRSLQKDWDILEHHKEVKRNLLQSADRKDAAKISKAEQAVKAAALHTKKVAEDKYDGLDRAAATLKFILGLDLS